MIDKATNTLAAWSVMTYGVIVQAYPYSFRRQFGESMTQVFTDLVHDARNAGLGTLAILWMRTVRDVAVSLVTAYSREAKEPAFRPVLITSALYLGALVLVTGYGAVAFGEYYEPPAFSRFGAPGAHEDELIATYEKALTGEFGQYRTYARSIALTLAIWLGVASALFGQWQRNILHGAAAFLAGTTVTIAVLSLLPTIWFPLDRYPVGALWVMGVGLPISVATWLLLTFFQRLRPYRPAAPSR